MQISMFLLICSFTLFSTTVNAQRPIESSFLSASQLNLSEEPLHLEQNFFAQNAASDTANESVQISYRYKLLIGDLSALSLLLAAPFTDGMSAPFAVASYLLASPLLHYFEPDNQESGSKALKSLWYRVGIPMVGAALTFSSLYFAPEGNGLLAAYALGLGSIIGGSYGLYKDYSNAVKTKKSSSSSATAYLFNDPASREVMMWQALMARDARARIVSSN